MKFNQLTLERTASFGASMRIALDREGAFHEF